jgi:NAD(P)-dependent dehydrogenase (short-subunit alcohol dehydrogenase family)
MKLENKKVVIVGASSGIGAELARVLARKGCEVALVARREEALKSLSAAINQQEGKPVATVYPSDVTDFDKSEALLDAIARDLGGLDGLFYCAGVMPKVKPGEYDFSKDRQMIEVNLLGAIAWINSAAKRFSIAKSGVIVAISSIAGDRGRASAPGYMTSKAALSAYMESIRNRISRFGVRVVTIKPGFVDTEMLAGVQTPIKPSPVADVVRDIIEAVEGGDQVRYTPGFWKFVGFALKHMPSPIMQRLNF